ncbi:MAG: asparagine synthase (glutamine-hydrolyzing) [Planctomycetota bacterium]|jgi:asparagine synthase (glutamine-hydrolysing)
MCGIAGIVNFRLDRLDRQVIEDMITHLRHRGPDDEGIYQDKHVLLGHTRLSIIDVQGSAQPLSNEDGSVWLVFNGEIYNYQELRKKLIGTRHRFRTNGDTETLVHLYEEYGEQMADYLQGMFAFAIWDKKKQLLLIMRDRMGIKPLYYCEKGDSLLFASEPKAFFCYPEIKARPNAEGIWHYLTYRSVPAPTTLFDGIFKVKPGHMLTVTDKGTRGKCYWDVPLIPEHSKKMGRKGDMESRTSRVEALLQTSVKRRLISDVPLGAFLSGGVDSSLIVALMSRLTNAPVKTYSVGFNDFPDSELRYAGMVAKQYETDHHELILEEDCFADYLEELTWIRDAPLSEPADVPLHLLAKMARRDVKVLLSGEGSDEIFAGYPKYAYDRFSPMVNLLPKRLTQQVERILPSKFRRVEVALKSLCEKDPAERWSQWFSPFTKQEKLRLVTSSNSWDNPTKQYVERASRCNLLDRMLYTDCKLWLADNLLDRGDRMTMGVSVEGRVPFLDHELVEFAFSLPMDAKVKGFTRKWQVKQIALKFLPECIVNRRKVGFSVPLAQWFRGKLRNMCYDRICQNNGFVGQFLARDELQKILDDHCSNRKDNALKIWTLLGLTIWGDVFCGNTATNLGRKGTSSEVQ